MKTQPETEKYYVPEIESFHVGFEFHVKIADAWVSFNWDTHIGFNEVIIGHDTTSSWTVLSKLKEGHIRVRYLSHGDIVGEGWEKEGDGTGLYATMGWADYTINSDKMGLGFTNYGKPNTYKLSVRAHPTLISIRATGSPEQIFSGTIRNRSELKMVMKMLGIK